MTKHGLEKPLAIAIAMASGVLSGTALAQNDTQRATVLEEVVVTAEKREASLQDTPISISALSSTALENMGVSDLSDIGKNIPNLEMAPFPNSRSAYVLFIRGVGSNESQTTQDPAVGVYYDGVYVARNIGLSADATDLERIEVLRGPQGILYGRNTTGGAVNIISAKPTGELGFKQMVSSGNYGYWRSQTQLNLPEAAGLSAKISFDRSEKDGWRDNLSAAGHDFQDEDKASARLAVRWAATDDLTVDYAYDQSNIVGPQGYYQLMEIVDPSLIPFLGPYTSKHRLDDGFQTSPVQDSDTDIQGHGLTISWQVGDVTLKSITGYREMKERIEQNFSGNPFIEFLNVNSRTHHRQFSQELQAVGDALDGKLKYVAGLYYFDEHGYETEYNTSLSSMVNPIEFRYIKSDNSAWAAYGQVTWTPVDPLDITLGVRYTVDEREAEKYSNIGFPCTYFCMPRQADEDYSNFNPALTINYRWTDDLSTYAKAVTGYKAGGFNTRSTEAGFMRPYDEEEVTSYELGLKSTWLDQRVRVNAAAFYNDWTDMQQNFILNPGVPFLTDTFNAGEAVTQGVELEVVALLTEGLQLSVSYAITDSEFTEVIDQAPLSPTYGQDVSGWYTMPYAPDKSYSVALDYDLPAFSFGNMSLHVDYSWRDDTTGTAPPQDGFELPDYGLWNARITLADVAAGSDGSSLKFALWGKNLTDEEYLLHTVGFGVVNYGWFGEPRTYGLDVTYEYR